MTHLPRGRLPKPSEQGDKHDRPSISGIGGDDLACTAYAKAFGPDWRLHHADCGIGNWIGVEAMTTRIIKTWFDGEKVVTQEIPEAEIYKRPWEGLTDAEIQKCYSEAYRITHGRRLEVTFARAIEAKLKEKNT